MRSLKISDHLIANPVKIASTATIGEAARTIIDNKVSGVIVVVIIVFVVRVAVIVVGGDPR